MSRIVLAGGGTAGHTSPMIATAQALAELEPEVEITCIGTPKGLETSVIPAAGLELKLIRPVPMPRKLNLDLLKLPWNLIQAVRETRAILKQTRAQAVIGYGGYVSIPAYLAAITMRIPLLVHEANCVVGLANKVGARFSAFTGYTFPSTKIHKGRLIGMPINRSITKPSITPAEAREGFGLDPQRMTLLVSGGSQGAKVINEALAGALERILDADIQVLHVLGRKNFTAAHQVITGKTGARYLPVDYVSEMVHAYRAADLMVGRAGAGTVMETAVLGLPVIFIPLPWGNGEQSLNSADLVADGAGVLLPEEQLSADTLAQTVISKMTDAAGLAEMSSKTRSYSPANAADVLARAALSVVRGEDLS